MSFSLTNVQEFARTTMDDGSIGMRLIRSNPYVRLRKGDDPPIFVQSGIAYWEDGKLVETMPEWFEEEAKKTTARVQKETGLDKLLVQSLDKDPFAKPKKVA